MAAKKKSKSRVNEAGNYTKPGMRKKQFNRIKAGSKGGKPGQWSARKAQMLAAAYKKAGGGYKAEGGLIGGQKKIDVAAPYGKITGADFKVLRKRKP